ncbi:hypothetical protein JNUCC64_10960 [Streptomyces sp. JNUCC 64]
MNLRRNKTGRRTLTAVAATTLLIFAVGGCGGDGQGGEKEDDKPAPKSPTTAAADKGQQDVTDEASAEAPENETLSEVKGNGLTLAVTAAVRDQGGFVTVRGRVTNGSGKPWSAGDWRGDERELSKNGGSVAGASLVDNGGKKKYLVLRDTEGRCLCTRFSGGVMSGETVDWFAQFPAPPEGTTKVDFQVGSMPPAAIEISEGE